MDEGDVPELILARVVTATEPFAVDDDLSIAFTSPAIGRLVPHVDRSHAATGRRERIVPDAIVVEVRIGSNAYARGVLLTLSFIDPRFARIVTTNHGSAVPEAAPPQADPIEPAGEVVPQLLVRAVASPARSMRGVTVRMEWTPDRARRFVQIVDKLFTVDRLGWYRHVLAMRLLVPDEIDCHDRPANAVATSHLQMLRAATIETLGRPLLAACMPAFSVTSEWLESVDSPDVARAIAGLRTAIVPFSYEEADIETAEGTAYSAIGVISRAELSAEATASADAFLAVLLPSRTSDRTLCEHLAAYRGSLYDVFAQTARSTEAVRLGRMSETNHVLDDRLWQLAGIIGKTLGGVAVA